MVYKLATLADLASVPLEVMSAAVRKVITDDLRNLDRAYGANRIIEEDDGGYVLFCTPQTSTDEIKAYFDPDRHIPEWVEALKDDPSYVTALFLLHNDYGVLLVMESSSAYGIFDSEE